MPLTPSGSEILVNTATAGTQNQSKVTDLAGGGFVVTWTDYSLGVGGAGGDTSSGAVKAQVFTATGAPSGSEIRVNTFVSGDQSFPEIGALPGGGFFCGPPANTTTTPCVTSGTTLYHVQADGRCDCPDAQHRSAPCKHVLAVLIDLDEGADRIEFAGTICLAIATADDVASRRSRIVGGRDWVRLGAVEMGLDCLRRYLQGLPVTERIDFEKAT